MFIMILVIIFTLTMGLFNLNQIHKVALDNAIEDSLNESTTLNNSILHLIQIQTASKMNERGSTLTKDEKTEFIEGYLVKQSRFGKRYYLVDSNGVAFGNRSKDIKLPKAVRREIRNNDIMFTLDKTEDSYQMLAYTKVFNHGSLLIIVTKVDLSHLIISERESYNAFTLLFCIFVIVLLFCSLIFTNYITKDLNRLNKVSNEIIKGNYSIKTDIKGKDEISELAKSFDLMSSEIDSKVRGLNSEVLKTQKLFDNLTHEIKTPLTSIIGYADFLRKNEYNEDLYDKALSHIYREGKRLSTLSTKLIQVVDLKKSSLDIRSIKVKDLIEECISINRYKTYDKNIEFEIEKTEFILTVDTELMKNVITNIIDNAIKASHDTGKIKVYSVEGEKEFCLYIKDYGKGMEVDAVENIFEPFYKEDDSRTNIKDGLGLGLSISKDIMTLHEANINITSKKDVGTTVELQFPICS